MKKKHFLAIATLLLALGVAACGGKSADKNNNRTTDSDQVKQETDSKAPVIEGLTYESTLELKYAKCFQAFRYEGGYLVIRVDDGRDYIVVPEGKETPSALPKSCTVMKKPLDRVYLQATSSISLIDAIDAIDHLRLSGTKQDGWYNDNMVAAMKNGDVIYSGKYSEPDYELMISEKCNLAVESTMILHNPEVLEKLEAMGIPVFIERCSYETHPLGKTEWIKLYGELFDKREEAEAFFNEQAQYVENLENFENTEKTVAFFYVNQNGTVVARKSADSVPKMIELAGGRYVFTELGSEDNAKSGVNMTMEEFYATAKDADYIIYNASIDEPLEKIDDLLAKSNLFADFKAVKEGNVWSTGKSMHQATAILGSAIKDFNTMLTDDKAEELQFMKRIH